MNESSLNVKYKIFLHKLNTTSNSDVKSLFYGTSKSTDSDASKLSDKSSIKYQDAVDYFDVKSDLHWYRLRDNRLKYKQDWKADLLKFKANLSSVMESGKLKDITTIDITPYVQNITGYSNKISDLDNAIGFEISFDEQLSADYAVSSDTTLYGKKLRDLIEENQIIEICVCRDQSNTKFASSVDLVGEDNYHIDSKSGSVYYTEFMGFIGTLSYTQRHGDINSMAVNVYGLHKLLTQSNTINTKAIYDQFEEGIELTNPNVPVFITNWNSLNVMQIFTELMSSMFSAYPVNTNAITADRQAQSLFDRQYAIQKNLDLQKANEEKQIYIESLNGATPDLSKIARYDKNIEDKLNAYNGALSTSKTSKSIYEKSIEAANKKSDVIYYQQSDQNFIESFRISFLTVYLFFQVRNNKALFERSQENSRFFEELRSQGSKQNSYISILEHGEHKAYNEAVASAFKMFYSEMQMPSDLCTVIRDVALYDVFESRDNMFICRPPRYNQLSLNNMESFPRVNTSGEWSDLSDDDEFVIKSEDVLTTVYNRSDMDLVSRCDAKNMLPFIGTLSFFGDNYTDPNILFKYGLRTDPPQENPNVNNSYVAGIYSALYLYRKNSLTRQINIEVPNNRKYYPGNLYLIEMSADDPKDLYVGYLMESEITFGYGKVTKNILKFAYVRKVETKLASSITDPSELEMVFTIYKDMIRNTYPQNDFYDIEKSKASRILLAERFVSGARSGEYLFYFSVIPSILDIINDAEENNAKYKLQVKTQDADQNVKKYAKETQFSAKNAQGYYYFKLPAELSGISENPNGLLPAPRENVNTERVAKSTSQVFIPYVDISNDNGILRVNGIKQLYERNLHDIGYTRGAGAYGSSNYEMLQTPFAVGRFGFGSSGEELVDQRLINLMSSIDVSLKMFNKKNMGFLGNNQTSPRLDGYHINAHIDGNRLIYDSMENVQNEKIRRYDMFILQHIDSFVWESDFYNIAPTVVKQEYCTGANIHSQNVFLYKMPQGKIYNRYATIVHEIPPGGQTIALDVYQYNDSMLQVDIYVSSSSYADENNKVVLTKITDLPSSFGEKLLVSKGSSGTTMFLGFLPFYAIDSSFDANYFMYDLAKVVDVSVNGYSGLTVGFRSPKDSDAAAKNGEKDAILTKDAHSKGLAIDVDTFNMRIKSNGYVGVKYIEEENRVSKNGLHQLLYMITMALSDYKFGNNTMASKNIFLIKFPGKNSKLPSSLAWIGSDLYMHIEANSK